MRQRQRPPILNLLQLAIFGFIFWQVYGAMSGDPADAPATMFDSTFRTMRLIFLGILASIALNLLYPLAAWGIGRLRERQAAWSPDARSVVTDATDDTIDRHYPGCGASLFDDAPTCPWCGHRLA